MTTSARLVDSAGTELLRMDPTWAEFTLNRLDLGFPEVRAVSDPLAGGDGEVDSTQYVGARAITAALTLSRPVGPKLDLLRGLCHPGRRLWLHVARDDWDGERRILVRGNDVAAVPANLTRAQVGWRAPAGLLEAVAADSVTLSPVGNASGGAAYPLTYPVAFNPGLVPGAALLQVGGTVPAPPIIDIYGPCHDPLVRLIGTGEQVRLLMPVAAGQFVRVDMTARTVLLNGDPNQSRYGRLDFATSSWWALSVGNAVQVVFSPEGPGAGCQAVLRWRRKWI